MPVSAAAFRRRAEQCLRFADQLALSADPSVPALRALARDYEAAAHAFEVQPPRRTDGPLTLPRREPDSRSPLGAVSDPIASGRRL